MDDKYVKPIIAQLHPMYPGLKTPEHALLLSGILCSLEHAGARELVRSFVSQMHKSVMLEGFLLEVMLADTLLQEPFSGKISCNRQDGMATKPCDITYEEPCLRIDAQCKTLQNIVNEQAVADFLAWVERKYEKHRPGALLELMPEHSARDRALSEMKSWFAKELPSLYDCRPHDFESSDGGRVRVQLYQRSEAGIVSGIRWGSVERLGLASAVDWDDLRKRICMRFAEAKPTFTADPDEHHLNLLVIELPRMSLLNEDDVYCALYGKPSLTIENGCAVDERDNSGAYFSCRSDHVSAVVVNARGTFLRKYDWAVYPHPNHVDSIQNHLIGRGPFRWGRVH